MGFKTGGGALGGGALAVRVTASGGGALAVALAAISISTPGGGC